MKNTPSVFKYVLNNRDCEVFKTRNYTGLLRWVQKPQAKVLISFINDKDLFINDDEPKYVVQLLNILYERYKVMQGEMNGGLTIIEPNLSLKQCQKVQAFVLELAHLNKLEFDFLDWIENYNIFHNSFDDVGLPN